MLATGQYLRVETLNMRPGVPCPLRRGDSQNLEVG